MSNSEPGNNSMCGHHRREAWPVLLPPAAVGVFCLCLLSAAHAQQCPIVLRDVGGRAGIDFVHTDGSSGRRYMIEGVCCGLATFDYDNDGDVDIYFLNGAPLRGTTVRVAPTNQLWRNDGGWRFTNVTRKAGVGDTGYGLGVAVGDYDNDGCQDLYLNNYGPNVLYRNNGDGTFSDVTGRAGVANGHKVGAGANFLDIDADGDLDLYVSNYVDFTYQNHRTYFDKGFPKYAGPMDFPPTPETLFRNNRDGTFTDVSEASGVAAHEGTGMGTVCADFDDDGDTDVFVANDVAGNFLFQNDGRGKFREVALVAGTAYDLHGHEQASMGVDCGDYDNDGRLDFYQTSYALEPATLFRNLGGGLLEDVTVKTRAADGTYPYVTWGNGLVDFDNDGDLDIFVACGDIQDNVERWDDVRKYMARNVLLINTGEGKFVNVSDRCGDGLAAELSSRGAAFDDLDNDGDIDVVVLNSRRGPTLLRNDSAAGYRWIQVQLRGTKANRDGVGARVKITAGDLTRVAEVHSGRSYQSHYGTRLHFGLGKRDRVDRIEVRWPGGRIDAYTNLPANRFLVITEGDPAVRQIPRPAGRSQ